MTPNPCCHFPGNLRIRDLPVMLHVEPDDPHKEMWVKTPAIVACVRCGKRHRFPLNTMAYDYQPAAT